MDTQDRLYVSCWIFYMHFSRHVLNKYIIKTVYCFNVINLNLFFSATQYVFVSECTVCSFQLVCHENRKHPENINQN